MCTSNIVMSNMNIGTISFDDFGGVNFGHDCFSSFEFAPEFRQKLLSNFGYYIINGENSRSKYEYEASNVIFKEQRLSKEL